jgi:hypothetical protein
MNDPTSLTNPTASKIRRTSEWLEFATDTYLDQRHRNWGWPRSSAT